MVNKSLYDVEIEQLVKELGLSKAQAVELVESHSTFVEKLAGLENPPFALSLIITTAISIASLEDIAPEDFLRLVIEVMEVCSDAGSAVDTYVADA